MSMCICSSCGKSFDSDLEGEIVKFKSGKIKEYCEFCNWKLIEIHHTNSMMKADAKHDRPYK